MAKRAMSHEKASAVKLSGHAKEKEFAKLIGLNDEYKNDKKAKKDVIDFNGDAHSVKSGAKKWQVFFIWGKQTSKRLWLFSYEWHGATAKKLPRCIPSKQKRV